MAKEPKKEEKSLAKPETTEPKVYERFFAPIYKGFGDAIKQMGDEIDKQFGELEKRIADFKITTEVKSEKDKYLVTFKLGKEITDKDLELEYEGDMLILSINKEKKTNEGIETHSFRRTEYLPNADATRITTEYKEGILKVEMPLADQYMPKKIPINTKK
ncbi:Hsp20/alpha crystallin family protein [Candidatus Woesearchaeota archaeon]|nr:Hsp20/alpha crystallin family protein [Candidatus Woesearchaeota archaeon]